MIDIALPDDPDNYGARIRYARLKKGLTQVSLGSLIKERQQLIHEMEKNHGCDARVMLKIALVTGVSLEWLITGEDRFRIRLDNGYHQTVIDQNKHATIVGITHLIEWQELDPIRKAGDIKNIENRKIIPLIAYAGPNSFGLILTSNSMASLSAEIQDFKTGTMLLFDPDRDARPGSFVLVYQDGIALFRQLSDDFGTLYLTPLNPHYPTLKLKSKANIRGVLVCSLSCFDTPQGVPRTKEQAQRKDKKNKDGRRLKKRVQE